MVPACSDVSQGGAAARASAAQQLSDARQAGSAAISLRRRGMVGLAAAMDAAVRSGSFESMMRLTSEFSEELAMMVAAVQSAACVVPFTA